MKATSFLSFLFCIVMLLAFPFAPLIGAHQAGAESFAAYLCGCVAVLSIVRMFARGGVKAIEVPAPGFRRYLSVLYRMLDAVLFLTLAYHGHFVVASLVGIVLTMQLSALFVVIGIETDIKESFRKGIPEFNDVQGESGLTVTGQNPITGADTRISTVNPGSIPQAQPA
ncbi:hypothetical protein WS84_28125 [Burkholderia anthina]|uniref:hypothetical protein n=1 Tax=Burkholderia anthina TaxID=179879 RepID=UPI0007573BFD|nr:hypothetical protein [Burkholderia anthina]KVH05404.1 hypothetical protein WS84_28125 [Burkholderia anthina]